MAKLTLKLTANVYFQAQSDDPNPLVPPKLVQFTKGDVFEARNRAEYDRLIEAGAAIDPQKAQEQAAADLRARREALETERAQLDAQLASLPGDNLADLKREDLNARASVAGVDDPEGLPNKDAVIDAIRQAEASQG